MSDYLTDLARRLGPSLVGEALENHASTHEDGGDDEIDVTDLSGVLADPQTPDTHADTHEAGAADELAVEALATALTVGQVAVSVGDGTLVAGDLENISTALDEGFGVGSDGAGALVAAPVILTYISDVIDHADLGSGASSAESLAPAFPDNVMVGPARVVVHEVFNNEADVAVIVGDAGDPNGKIEAFQLDGVATGRAAAVSGIETAFRFEADYTPVATFTATELSDLDAGKASISIDYYFPNPAELPE